jgi:hypothetical protein
MPIGFTVTGKPAVERVADVEETLPAVVPAITDEYGDGAFGQLAPSVPATIQIDVPVMYEAPDPRGLS